VIERVVENVLVELARVNCDQLGAGRFRRGQEQLVIGMALRVPVNGRRSIAGAGVALKNNDAVRFEVALDFSAKGVKISFISSSI